MFKNNKPVWYAAGLRFECSGCGNCCSGPGEGYIWASEPEIKFIADLLKISPEKLFKNYLRRIGFRFTILEQPATKDCIFLQKTGTGKQCAIYPVRPNQCRTWPFWPENLMNPDSWNQAAQRCSGMNCGRFYSFEKIEKIVASKTWWKDEPKPAIAE